MLTLSHIVVKMGNTVSLTHTQAMTNMLYNHNYMFVSNIVPQQTKNIHCSHNRIRAQSIKKKNYPKVKAHLINYPQFSLHSTYVCNLIFPISCMYFKDQLEQSGFSLSIVVSRVFKHRETNEVLLWAHFLKIIVGR